MFLLNWTMHGCSALFSYCLFQLCFLSDDSSLLFSQNNFLFMQRCELLIHT
jgi:hypothetical protein